MPNETGTASWWAELKDYDFAANIVCFRHGQTALCYDVNSNSLHRLDAVAFQVLQALLTAQGDGEVARTQLVEAEGLDAEMVDEILSELGELKAAGMLFTTDSLARRYLSDKETAANAAEPSKPVVKALCLHIAHDCNLRCSYCFAGTGPFGGDRSLMSAEVGKQAIDFLLAHSQGRRHVEIDFFGGEPLMNFDVVKELVAYAKRRASEEDKVLKLTLTTNGLLLDEEVGRYLNEEGLSVVLSLDGRRHVHDEMRPYVDGSGSYDDVVTNLQKFVQSRNGEDYYVRGTFTHHNPDFAADALHIHDLGFQHLSVEPVVAAPDIDYALKEEDLAQLEEQYRILAENIDERNKTGRAFNFFHFQLDLAHGPCLAKRLSGCGAGFEYMAVAPNGDLYPCHQFVGREKYLLGNVTTGLNNLSACDAFSEAHIYHKEGCPTCWARFLCSGGCHANNEADTGDLRIPAKMSCQLAKMRLKWALYAKALETC
ncbi:thioether cross-link-forming SCIFF peptide maturase [Heliobacillus mobilis]|uniref:Thioether cross-link-forming SCIFF peptide maturase n=1 Tax=Heliobacterium mobile TaxID=28064 RepID=A0A6I3SPG4_HELMO|nr:thioether cross-link-forming SCIFF peptide maturase [Heliobacterium mobile]MTV50616.1 thioether cross-link-forming SCIFF peptide maturase [Heliobacterium mobile]